MAGGISELYPDEGNADAVKIQGYPVSAAPPSDGQVLAFNSAIQEYVPATPAGGSSPAPVPLSTGTTLSSTHSGATLVVSSTPALTINTGLPSGFSCSIKGAFTYAGSATVSDVRNTGATNPWCALMNTATDTYDLVGGKA